MVPSQQNKEKRITILIAASGSGGHIFPALYVAESLKELLPNKINIEFVGSGRPLDHKLIPSAGYKLHIVSTTGVTGKGIAGLFKFVLKLPYLIYQTVKIIRSSKPDLVAGFGGYGSFMPITIARVFGISTWIHEAEVNPGLANKILSIYAHRISMAFKSCTLASKKSIYTGQPLKSEISGAKPKVALTSPPKNILILGGSQGSSALDNVMLELTSYLKGKEIVIHHQARPENVEKVKAAYDRVNIQSTVSNFITDMIGAYNFADIIIARSGAGTVAEISKLNIPTIFVPLPTSQGGHQLINAKELADIQKAVIVEEGKQGEDRLDFANRLNNALTILLELNNYNQYVTRPNREVPLNSAKTIATEMLKLIS